MKTLIVLLLVCISGVAQNTGQNVVSLTPVASNTVSATTTTTSTNIQNIGQSNHIGIINITTSVGVVFPSATCAIKASVDGTNYFNIGVQTTGSFPVASANQLRCYGFGAYPYIAVFAVVIPPAGGTITYSVKYQGSSIPSYSLIDLTGNNAGLSTSNNTLAGLQTIITSFPGRSPNIYGLLLFTDNTATTVTFNCVNSAGNTGTAFTLRSLGTLLNVMAWPGIRPILSCAVNDSITATLAGTPVTNFTLFYRLE